MRSQNPRKKNSASLVIYDAEEDLSRRCSLCFLESGSLINPCKCNMQYHQKCLLRYIREKLLSMKQQLDLTLIKCQVCKQQIRFLYYEHTHYSCLYFCNKLRKNWCNKTLIFIFFLLLVSIAMGIILAGHKPQDGAIYYGLLIGQSVICILLLAFLLAFIQTNLTYKEIILVKVFEYAQYMRNNSLSSQDSPQQNNIASETFEIIIDQQY